MTPQSSTTKITDIDHGFLRIRRELKKMNEVYVKVGILSDAGTYPENQGNQNLADVAIANEYGTETIPPRPFMRQSFDKNQSEIVDFEEKQKSQIFLGEISTEKALDTLGVFFKGKIQEEFVEGKFAKNAPVTIARKGSSQPLIDTGRLRQSIDHQVETKKE